MDYNIIELKCERSSTIIKKISTKAKTIKEEVERLNFIFNSRVRILKAAVQAKKNQQQKKK